MIAGHRARHDVDLRFGVAREMIRRYCKTMVSFAGVRRRDSLPIMALKSFTHSRSATAWNLRFGLLNGLPEPRSTGNPRNQCQSRFIRFEPPGSRLVGQAAIQC